MTTHTLPEPTTSHVDYYHVDITLPATEYNAAVHVTWITVTLTPPGSDDPDYYDVNVTVNGRVLTKAGEPYRNRGVEIIYGAADREALWTLEYDAAVASLTRHGIDVTRTGGRVRPWAQYRAEQAARWAQYQAEQAAKYATIDARKEG